MPTRAARCFSVHLGRKVPEASARSFKSEYLQTMKAMARDLDHGDESENVALVVNRLPTKTHGRPLLLGHELDKAVQEYITAMWTVGGVVNMTIIMADAEGTVSARDVAMLSLHGGHIQITKTWAESLLKRMGYVKRKCSNAEKVSVTRFEEIHISSSIFHLQYFIFNISSSIFHLQYFISNISSSILHLQYFIIFHLQYFIFNISSSIFHNISSPIFHLQYFIFNISSSIFHLQYFISNISSPILHLQYFISNISSSIFHLQYFIFNISSSILHLQYYIFNISSSILHLQYFIFNISSPIFHLQYFIFNIS